MSGVRWCLGLAAAAAVSVQACNPSAEEPPAAIGERSPSLLAGGGDWPAYRHDLHSTWYNPAQFTAADALALAPAWTFTANSSTFAEPVLAGGTVFLTTAGSKGGKIYALDATTGAQRWVRGFPNLGTDPCTGATALAGIQGAPSVVGGVVYIDAADGVLYALDAGTGATRWQARIADPTKGETMVDSPVVSTALGKVFIATSAVAEDCLISPHIAAVDLATGAVQSRTFLAPGHVGGSIWSSLTVDESTRKVFATTGNSPSGPAGDPLTQAFVAFDAATLAVVDHWQVPTRSTNDADFGASPTLFEAADGTPLVGTANKDGNVYVLRRNDLAAGPIWKYPIAVYGGPEEGKSSVVAPSFAGGVLYAAGEQTPSGAPGQVVALDPGTGAVLWTHIAKGYVLPGMPVLGDVLVVAETAPSNGSATVELLDRADGHVIRSYAVSAPVWGAPSAGQGKVLFTDIHGHLQVLAGPAAAGGGSGDGGVPDGGLAPDGGRSDGGAADGGTADGGADAGTAGGGSSPDGGSPGETVLFRSDLTAPGAGLGPGWTIASGAFTRSGGSAQPSAPRAYAFANAAPPDTQTVSVRIAVAPASRYNGVVARGRVSALAANHYVGYLNSDGRLWIARRNAYVYTYLGSTGPLAAPGTPHTLALRSSSTPSAVALTLLLDGAPALSVVDSSPQRLSAPGLAGIFSYGGAGASFRDFVLESP